MKLSSQLNEPSNNIDLMLSDDAKQLVITIDLTRDFGFSKSAKNVMIASTSGNKGIPAMLVAHWLGLNLYRVPTEAELLQLRRQLGLLPNLGPGQNPPTVPTPGA